MQETEISLRLKEFLRRFRYGSAEKEEKEKKKTAALKKRLLELSRSIASLGLSFLLDGAKLGSGISPFGSALLLSAEKNVVFIFLGLTLSLLVRKEELAVRLVMNTLVLMSRYFLSKYFHPAEGFGKRLYEPRLVRVGLAAICGFTYGLMRLSASGFSKTELYISLVYMLSLPLITFLFCGISAENGEKGRLSDAGRLVLIFASVLSLSDIIPRYGSFFGISASVIAATAVTLVAAVGGGAFYGGLFGMVSGLACGTEMSALLGISGVIAGTLRHMGTILPMLAFSGVGVTFGFVTEGILSFGGTVPSLMWGCALYAPIAKLGLVPRVYSLISLSGGAVKEKNAFTEAALSVSEKERLTSERLSALSSALSSLSTVFYALSNRISSPGIYEIRTLCEKTFKGYCQKCGKSTVCWGREYERTTDTINKLAAAVAKNGTADSEYIPKDFFDRCPNVMKAISSVNLSHARMLEEAASRNKTEIFALDYEAMAKLLESSSAEAAEEYSVDEKLSERVRALSNDIGLRAVGISVFGKRKKKIIAGGVDPSCLKLSAAELCSELERVCEARLTLPEFEIDGDFIKMTSVSAKKIIAEAAKASVKKDSETVNGDSAVTFSNKEDFFYSLISDGMGSGRDAAITSRITAIFLEKMLSSGNRKGIVLKMLNNFIRNKNLECFSTVDLLEIDLISGSASFIKSGAASSYILRNGKLFKITSASLPIGITREITAEEISFALKPDDLIIMISDGISQSFEDGVWLVEMLAKGFAPELSLDDISSRILETAKISNKRSDDMTVIAVKIKEA